MELLLVRHAIAEERDPLEWPDDSLRPLSARGEQRFRRAAAGLASTAGRVDLLLSSPYRRAWDTAMLLHDAGWPAPVVCHAATPDAPSGDTLVALRAFVGQDRVALVGHEPALSSLLAILLSGRAERIDWKKGGAACLDCPGLPAPAQATLRWFATPRLLRGLAG